MTSWRAQVAGVKSVRRLFTECDAWQRSTQPSQPSQTAFKVGRDLDGGGDGAPAGLHCPREAAMTYLSLSAPVNCVPGALRLGSGVHRGGGRRGRRQPTTPCGVDTMHTPTEPEDPSHDSKPDMSPDTSQTTAPTLTHSIILQRCVFICSHSNIYFNYTPNGERPSECACLQKKFESGLHCAVTP